MFEAHPLYPALSLHFAESPQVLTAILSATSTELRDTLRGPVSVVLMTLDEVLAVGEFLESGQTLTPSRR
jgi:hypothetical protein